MNRRDCLQYLKAMGMLSIGDIGLNSQSEILKRTIPSSGEKLPVIGVGTWQTFDVPGAPAERDPVREVLKILFEKGGTVVDSSPMYGRSEGVVGDLSEELKINDKLFLATKVWTTGKESGIRQMNESLRLMKRKQMDLMQIHNLTDWQTHIKTLRSWKDEGKVRYIGLTHYTESAHDRLVTILGTEEVDFIQINYNLLDRNAENKLLPYAREKNVAVVVNQPFESGNLFQRVKGKALPSWARDIDCTTWAQFFLKYIISHPAVTCAIPGTDKPHHMLDNIGAAFGRLPTEKQRQMMINSI